MAEPKRIRLCRTKGWRLHRHRWEPWSVSWREPRGVTWIEMGATWQECARCPAVRSKAGLIYRQFPGAHRVGYWLRAANLTEGSRTNG